MPDLNRDALDRWITGGRYHKSFGYVHCPNCGDRTYAVSETEYGATTLMPEDCAGCGYVFEGDEDWEDHDPEPDPDELLERMRLG
jgi:rubredoxin